MLAPMLAPMLASTLASMLASAPLSQRRTPALWHRARRLSPLLPCRPQVDATNTIFILLARVKTLRDMGGALSPFNAFQLIQA